MNRREALVGLTANLTIVSPHTAFGWPANSAELVSILGTGGRGRYDGTFFAENRRARIAPRPLPFRLRPTRTRAPRGSPSTTINPYVLTTDRT